LYIIDKVEGEITLVIPTQALVGLLSVVCSLQLDRYIVRVSGQSLTSSVAVPLYAVLFKPLFAHFHYR
jgi:hypothetical protein